MAKSSYDPANFESKWYRYWMDHELFSSSPNPDKSSYTIVIPPPNVTGVLHMGHMLNNTIQDVLIRKARMEGKEACWVPGTDHASIATENKVVQMLREQGKTKQDLSREAFVDLCWEWTHKYGGIILEQLKKLGASCDWERTQFTMDDEYYRDVIKVFVDLYRKGYVYRGVRMVNWDPESKTALSDEEVNYREVPSKLYYVDYEVEGSDDKVTIATTRPETILGDTAVCVHPDDQRYRHLHGQRVLVPMVQRSVPVIVDDYVSMEFGTGCLKITPAHDLNDYEIGQRHQLESIDIFTDDGKLNEKAQKFIGEDRFTAREKVVEALKASGQLVKIEDHTNNVGFSERTEAVIEPRLSMQWFMRMEELSKPALDHVLNGNINFYPHKFINSYRHWMENIRDWCISRQLWWGHRIPAYFLPDGNFVVAETREEALKLARKINPELQEEELRQDEDVLDTWASSWLWPIAVFDGISHPDNEEIQYYYPTQDLVTAPEILFFWVARMIMSGYQYQDEKPFKNVYLTGIVRDKKRRKMSKSLGNSPDPLHLISIYGADGVRTGMLFSSPAGNDLLFDEKLCEQGRNFSNKIWNAHRLVQGWEIDNTLPDSNQIAIEWFENRFQEVLEQIGDYFGKFRISDALMAIYKLIWDDFCSWYLEMIKPGYQAPIDRFSAQHTISFFEDLMKLLHPFMPFITEEIWQQLGHREQGASVMMAPWPEREKYQKQILEETGRIFEVIGQVRNARKKAGVSPKEPLELYIMTRNSQVYEKFRPVLVKLGKFSELHLQGDLPDLAGSRFVVKEDECLLAMDINTSEGSDKEALMKELDYTRGFLASIEKKLANKGFTENAPQQVVDNERKKQADALAKIKALETSLSNF